MNKTLNLDQTEFKSKVNNLVQQIKSQTQDNVIDGIIEEIATNRLIYQEILKKLDVIDSQLVINDLEIPVYTPKKVADELIITADFPLSADQGFYELEYDKQGKTMRWTGLSNSFFFDLCFDRTKDKKLILEALSPLSEQNISQMQCFVDNSATKLSISQEQGNCQVTASIPATSSVTNTKISFVVPELIKPCDIDAEQKDTRTLGVVFYRLVIQNQDENN
ncbi:MAG: hypothetical protein AB4038_03140 [Prochloraceae cyanobacterium]